MPEIIDDCIKANQAKFWKVCASMDAEDLYDRLTIVYPVMHCADLPGVSKFPVDEWVKQGKPVGRLGAHTGSVARFENSASAAERSEMKRHRSQLH